MATPDLDIQGEWDPQHLRRRWPTGPDNWFIHERLQIVPVEATALGASGRVLEIAAAQAIHSCRIAAHGLTTFVVEPSPPMLAQAREHMAEFGVHLHLIRGIGETLPFPDHSFDRILIDSALDHLAAPDMALREMIRVLKPDGRLIVTFVNYGSLSVRWSRFLYRFMRAVDPSKRDEHLFWDSPVPDEHTFECTYGRVQRLCGQFLEFERAVGVSMLWQSPGWGDLLSKVNQRRSHRVLDVLDRVARRIPGLADFVLMVWRPRTAHDPIGIGLHSSPRLARIGGAKPELPPARIESMRVTPADPVYLRRRGEDAIVQEGWASLVLSRFQAARPYLNRALTGDASRSWLQDLAARGPFGRTAAIGCDDEDEVDEWLAADGGGRLEVRESRRAVVERLRTRLAARAHRAQITRADLNFMTLPPRRYDAAWSGRALSRVVNLEYVFDEIAATLRPGGLFAFSCYVGERRQQFDPARLERVNAAFREVPLRFRFGREALETTHENLLGPFTAVRSDEIVPLATERFDVVHDVRTSVLFPVMLFVDLPTLEREAPEVLARLLDAEAEAQRDPSLRPCWAYVVLRRRR